MYNESREQKGGVKWETELAYLLWVEVGGIQMKKVLPCFITGGGNIPSVSCTGICPRVRKVDS